MIRRGDIIFRRHRTGPCRRDFIASAAACVLMSPVVRAESFQKTRHLALLMPSAPLEQIREGGEKHFDAFFRELRRLGYIEGENLVVSRRTAEGRTDWHEALAREVVALRPDVIYVHGARLAADLRAASSSVPIVGLSVDPVRVGLAASLARPGGNFTGLSIDVGYGIMDKRLELLREVLPQAKRFAYLVPKRAWESSSAEHLRTTLKKLGLSLVGEPMAHPVDEAEYRRAFAAMRGASAEALMVGDQPEHLTNQNLVVTLAAKERLPVMYPYADFPHSGGLMAYAVDAVELNRRAAGYVHKVFEGADPAEIPIEQPSKFDLLINLKTAKALGITIPRTLLARADEVVE